MSLIYSNFNPSMLKKYSKNLSNLPQDLVTEVCLFKILEHDKLKFVQYLSSNIIEEIKKQTDIKFYNINKLLRNNLLDDDKNIILLLDLFNKEDTIGIYNLLDKFATNIYYTNIFRRILSSKKFRFTNLEIYLKSNLYVPKIVFRFLNLYKKFLPINFLSILLNSNIEISYFLNMIRYTEDIIITEELMKYDFFLESAIRQGFSKNPCLIKYVKREDYEFYLVTQNDVSLEKDKSLEKSMPLDLYYNNGVPTDHKYYPHMQIYHLPLDSKDKLYSIFKNINLPLLFNRDVDILLLEFITKFLCHYKDTKSLDEIFFYNEIYNNILDICLYKNLVNFNMIEYLKSSINKFRNIPEDFLRREINLKDIEKFKDTNLRKEVIERARRSLSTELLVKELKKKFEDERGIYYEILHNKVSDEIKDGKVSDGKISDGKISDGKISDETISYILNLESNNKHFLLYKEFLIENYESDLIYNNLKGSKFLFKYCLRHKKYSHKYLESINKEECNLEEARNIYELGDNNIKDDSHQVGNLLYKIATCNFDNLDSLTEDKVNLTNLVYNIRREDGIYLFYKYSDLLISHYIKENSNLNKKQRNISDFDYMNYLSNPYIIHSIDINPRHFRYILKFIDNLDYKYIKILINLLNDTNINCVGESKRILKNMKCTNTDINNIKSQIIESFINKMNTNNTLLSILSLQFNYMIDDTSLYLIIELIRRYIKDYKEYIFIIINVIQKIIINKEYFRREIFQILSHFVIQNNFFTEDCIKVVKLNIDKLDIEDLDLLINNVNTDMRISYFLVEVLKILKDNELNKKVLSRNVGKVPNFLAYAFDLEIFYGYLDEYLPVLKDIYISRDNKIAVHAFSKLLLSDKEDISKLAFDYVARESFTNLTTRMSCIEILSTQPLDKVYTLLYIYKYDSNGLIRKRVNEILKNKVENYNILLKGIYKEILRYLDLYYKYIPDVCNNVIGELISKYLGILDIEYCKGYKNIYSIILLNGIKKNKLIEECKEYLISQNSNIIDNKIDDKNSNIIDNKIDDKNSNIIDKNSNKIDDKNSNKIDDKNSNKIDDKNSNIIDNKIDDKIEIGSLLLYKDKEFVYKQTNIDLLIQILENNTSYIYDLLMSSPELISNIKLLGLLNEDDKKKLFIHIINNNYNNDSVIFLLKNITNIDISEYDINTIYLYISNTNTDNSTLFKKVFSKLDNEKLQKLIKKKNIKFLLDVSYKNITEYDRLVEVLTSFNNISSIERLNEIFPLVDEINKNKIINYYIYNFLVYENRSLVRKILKGSNLKFNGITNEKLNIMKLIIN